MSRPQAKRQRRPTITDVAQLAGVSIKTVSRVANGVTTVSPELAERVRRAIAETGYRPNFLASKLKSGESTQTVALIAKNLPSEFTVSLLSGAETVVRRHSAQLITASTDESASSADDVALARDLTNRQIDGMMVMSTGGDYSAFSKSRFADVPVVFVDRDPGIDADTLVLDNEGGAAAAVAELIAAGHRRIAHLYTTMEISTMRERRRGVHHALREAGHLLSQAPDIAGVASRESAAITVGHLLDAANPPSAFFCATREIMLGAIIELVRRGRSDVAVAGFSRPRGTDLLPLPVTLVEADGFSLGRAAANRLYRRIQKPEAPAERIVIPTRLKHVEAVGLPR